MFVNQIMIYKNQIMAYIIHALKYINQIMDYELHTILFALIQL